MKGLIFGKTCLWLPNLLLRKQILKDLCGKAPAMDVSEAKRASCDRASHSQRPLWDNTAPFNAGKRTVRSRREKLLYLVQAKNGETNLSHNESDLIEGCEAFYRKVNCKF